jgi:hypothetical protein
MAEEFVNERCLYKVFIGSLAVNKYLLLFLFGLPIVHVAQIKTVTAMGDALVYGEITRKQAKSTALNQTRARAIEMSGSVNTRLFSVAKDQLLVADFIKTFMCGMTVEKPLVRWCGDWLMADDSGLEFPVVDATLKAKVAIFPKAFIRSGIFDTNLNQQSCSD